MTTHPTAAPRVALVTGAGSGIGKAVAIALVKEGYAVVLAGRRAGPLDETAGQLSPGGGRTLSVPTDVRDAESVRALFAKTSDAFGRLDLLFNNAGVNVPGVPLEELARGAVESCRRHQSDRRLSLHAAGDTG